jgi:hypothetical protein
MKTLKDEIREILGSYFDDSTILTTDLLSVIDQEVRKCVPEEKTTGIKGILGTNHIDNVYNEGFNT